MAVEKEDPTPRLEDDEIEVETGLPEPEAPAGPLTQEERDQRLEKIKARLIEIFPRYKKYAVRMHTVMIETGILLYEAKIIVGHTNFIPWVEANMPFAHETANGYMRLARANLKFALVANLALKGTIDAIEAYLNKKEEAKWRRWRRQRAKEVEEEERAASRAKSLTKQPLSKKERKRQRHLRNLRDQVLENARLARERSAEYAERNLFDLTKLPRPRDDCSWLEVEWQLPNGVEILGAYIWLPENAHADAHDVIACDPDNTRWKGSAALLFHSIIYTSGMEDVRPRYVVPQEREERWDSFSGEARVRRGLTWQEVQALLAELSRDAIETLRAETRDRDPAVVRILENWRHERAYPHPPTSRRSRRTKS
jgi:hypothetical protein